MTPTPITPENLEAFSIALIQAVKECDVQETDPISRFQALRRIHLAINALYALLNDPVSFEWPVTRLAVRTHQAAESFCESFNHEWTEDALCYRSLLDSLSVKIVDVRC